MPARELTPERRMAVAAFYSDHHTQVAGRVERRVRAVDEEIVADACGFAWLQLVSRADVRLTRSGLAWLTLVAIQEAWRLADPSRERATGAFLSFPIDEDELSEPVGPASDPLERVLAAELHRERIARFAGLKPRERRDLFLCAGGYEYREICAITDSTYTAVNRRITEGRARLRRT